MKKTIILFFLVIQTSVYASYAEFNDTTSIAEQGIVADPNDSAKRAEQRLAVQEALSKSRDNIEQMKAD